jgi:cyclophilin family peptidyl-prolyl cis-trans isomerase
MSDARPSKKELQAARREEEKKRAQRREFRRRVGMGLGIGILLAGGLFLNSYLSNRPEQLPAAYVQFRDQPTACGATQPPAEELQTFDAPTDQGLTADQTITATFRTSCGAITVTLDQAGAPATAESFVFLAREGFYDGTVFHRIVTGFAAQGGDPKADGTGNPGYLVPDEFPPEGFAYEQGVVAMANAGLGTTGSQFFFVLGDQAASLRPQFNVLGRVTDGAEVLDAIAAVPTSQQPGNAEKSLPLETVYAEGIDIETGG